MKKRLVFPFALGVSFILLVLWKLGGAFSLFHVQSSANAPTMNTGDYVITSSWKTPDFDEFISFKVTGELDSEGKETALFRVKGLPGDRVELRDGKVYVNDQLSDDSTRIKRSYFVQDEEVKWLENAGLVNKDEIQLFPGKGALLHLTLGELSRLPKEVHPIRQKMERGESSQFIYRFSPTDHWNLDFWGPAVVPQGRYFVLGDSRHNSMDSRFIGFIAQEDITGTEIVTF